MTKKSSDGPKILASNRSASHHFFLDETFEAGIVLHGTEVKALRAGKGQIADAYARVENNEVFLHNAHIDEYAHGNLQNHEPMRPRKLLLHRGEVRSILGKTTREGYTLIPTRIYLKGSHIKIAIALARGKKLHDKRESERRKESDREARAAMSARRARG